MSSPSVRAAPDPGQAGQTVEETPLVAIRARPRADEASEPVSTFDKRATFAVVTVLLAAAAWGTWTATMQDLAQYTQMFEFLQRQLATRGCVENLMALHVALTPFRSLALVRGAALFLSFSLVLLGSLFVLTGIKTAYSLNVEVPERAKTTMEASSPGLLLIAVGAALMAAALYRQGSPTFVPTNCPATTTESAAKLKDIKNTLNPGLR